MYTEILCVLYNITL